MPAENEIPNNENQEELKPVNSPFEDGQEDSDNDLDGEDELFKALRSLSDSEDDDEDETNDDLDDKDELEKNEDDLEENQDDLEIEDADKKVQSKEDNAKFAAQRRQKELDDRVQAELERLKQESPEFKLAKQLSEQFGKSPEEIIAEMNEAALIKQAEETKIPIETLRKEKAAEEKTNRLEKEINALRFESWKSKVEVEKVNLQTQYTMLNTEDMDKAVDYILTVAKNVNMPLEEAVYAVHGKKIIEALSKGKIQEELAAQSGRKKKTPLSPGNGKTSQTPTLTADEAYIAKQFGMTADEYIKNKS